MPTAVGDEDFGEFPTNSNRGMCRSTHTECEIEDRREVTHGLACSPSHEDARRAEIELEAVLFSDGAVQADVRTPAIPHEVVNVQAPLLVLNDDGEGVR